MQAASNGHLELAKYLLKHKADANLIDRKKFNALHVAILSKKNELAKYLIPHIDNLDAATQYDTTALYLAVIKGLTDVVELLLKNNVNVNCATKTGHTPLGLAAARGEVEIAKILLAAGADPNQPHLRFSLLGIATLNDNIAIIELLIKAGANIETKSIIDKKSLLAAAKKRDKPQTVIDKIEDYFKKIGSNKAEMSAIVLADLMNNTEAEILLRSKPSLTPEHDEPTNKKLKRSDY